MGPNVLCVVLDTARRDAFEPWGGAAATAPTVTQLASRGQVADAYSQASWTLPSHASIFTGLPSRALGLGQAPGGSPHGARPVLEENRDRLVPEVLRRAGYATAAVSANIWITPESGFATGFDDFEVVVTERQTRMHRNDPRAHARWVYEAARSSVDDGAAAAERAIARMVEHAPQRPFFWFVNLVECHSPYLPPRPYNDLGLLDRVRAGTEARRHLTLDSMWRACARGHDIPPDALARMRHLYARAIRYMDDWLARVLERLEARRLLDDTIVIVLSDHGENFGESGLIGHAFSLDERLIRVPLVAAGPVRLNADGVVNLMELPRLLAEATGVDDHPWEPSPWGDGIAVSQFEPPTGPDDPRAREAVDRWSAGDRVLPRITSQITSATDGERKLVILGDEKLGYDLRSDPLELKPIDPGGEAFAPLRAALNHPLAWAAPATRAPAPAPDPDELAQIERQMQLLGYM